MPATRRALLVVLVAGALAAAAPAAAQDYPKKQVIRIIVPQAVGSATDTVGRLLAQHIGAEIGQQIIVDNRPGAGGLLGSELAAKSPPDGYTLLLANISTHGVNPGLYAKLPYDPVKDFAPIGSGRRDVEHRDRERGASGQNAEGVDRARQGEARHAALCNAQGRAARSTWRWNCFAPWPAASTSRICPIAAAGRA